LIFGFAEYILYFSIFLSISALLLLGAHVVHVSILHPAQLELVLWSAIFHIPKHQNKTRSKKIPERERAKDTRACTYSFFSSVLQYKTEDSKV
jgi:hypothetical protein